jgi:glycosyltransferase involved in cell wall biosynthesis
VLQIGADRSKQGILYPDSSATKRQIKYGAHFDELDIIGFSRASDRREVFKASENVHVYPTHSYSPLLYGLDAIEIAHKLRKPRVVSAQDPFETGLIAWFIARMYGVPLHVQVHTDFLSPEYSKLSIVNRIRAQLAEFILRRATRVRVVSDRIKQEIERQLHLRVPISVIPIFADVEHMRNIRPQKELIARFAQFRTKLLAVSRLESEKNIRLAINAFAQSAPRDACLIIVGGGSRRAPLESHARKLGVMNRVFFEGAANASEYFALADLLLVPSRYEGYGLVIVESLAAGKPVLSTDVGIARDMGAIVTSQAQFTKALADWFLSGPRTGHLQNYPYKNIDQYVQAYSDDIRACTE